MADRALGKLARLNSQASPPHKCRLLEGSAANTSIHLPFRTSGELRAPNPLSDYSQRKGRPAPCKSAECFRNPRLIHLLFHSLEQSKARSRGKGLRVHARLSPRTLGPRQDRRNQIPASRKLGLPVGDGCLEFPSPEETMDNKEKKNIL